MTVTVTLASGKARTYRASRATVWLLWPFAWLAGSLTSWGNYWLAWLLAGFLVPELYLVAYRVRLGSLSDNVWAWEHLDMAHPFELSIWTWEHWALALLVWVLFAWLSVHLPFGLAR